MNNYTETDRIINVKDLLYRTCRKWRSILLWAAVIALLCSIFQVLSGVRVLLDENELQKAQSKYEVAVEDYLATGERLRTSIANVRSQSANQQEYNSKSALMQIDPMNKWVGSVQLYIDSMYQIDPSMTYQNIDLTGRLISAYSSYLRSGELFSELLEAVDAVDEIRFLSEIYSVSSDPATATVNVRCYGKDETDVREMLDFVKQKISEHYETICSAIGDHNVEILTESVYSTIDLELDAQQKANQIAIAGYANDIAEKTTALSDWERKQMPKQEFGAKYIAKSAVKSLILGGIVGIVLMICWYALRYVLSGAVRTDADLQGFKTPILGHIRWEEKKRRFLPAVDRLIDRIFGRTRSVTTEQSCALAAQNLSSVLRENGLSDGAATGCIPAEAAEELMKRMNAAGASARFRYAGDVLTDPAAAGQLQDVDKLFVLVRRYVTPLADVGRTMTLLDACGKTALGMIVIE